MMDRRLDYSLNGMMAIPISYPLSMKLLDSVGFKNDLGKALIAANGIPLAKSITQHKAFLNPSKKRLSHPTSSFHLFARDKKLLLHFLHTIHP